jgi:hypothetical protein
MPAFENQFYADVGFGFYERELGLLPTGVLPANLNETTGSGTTVPWGTVEAFIDPTEEREWTITLGVFAAANDNQVEAGIGYLREFYTAGVKTLDVVDPIYTDFMPLSRWNAADGRDPPSAIVPNHPPIAMPAGGMPSWLDYNDWNERPCVFWPAGDARLQFHAILSDDGDCHDPRANTADASLRAYLQAGSGLIYDGPYGQLPRPYSGATGIMLGRELTLAGGYSFDVVTTPRVGELMAALLDDAGQLLVWTAREVEGEWVATPAWNAPIADALPASVQAELAGAEPPQLTYRFVLPDWPHPTGVLSIGGTHTIFAARHRRNDRKYRTPGRPPIVTTFGWRDD